jgi:hypothetical protein
MSQARSVPNSQSTTKQRLRSAKKLECKHYLVKMDAEEVRRSRAATERRHRRLATRQGDATAAIETVVFTNRFLTFWAAYLRLKWADEAAGTDGPEYHSEDRDACAHRHWDVMVRGIVPRGLLHRVGLRKTDQLQKTRIPHDRPPGHLRVMTDEALCDTMSAVPEISRLTHAVASAAPAA